MGHIERRLRAKEEMKQSILDAAREIAAKEGWQAVTIRKIADKIEYSEKGNSVKMTFKNILSWASEYSMMIQNSGLRDGEKPWRL